jgi:CheY-like chemotaxis protein
VALRIRADRQIGATALVIMVSVDRPAEGASRKMGGICEQIVKPARSADLLRMLTDTLRATRSAGGAVQSDGNRSGGQKGLRAARRGGSGKVIQVAVAGSGSQRTMEQALEHTDHTYFIVDNGLIAAALVRELRPSLVIAEFPGPGGAATDLLQAVNLAGVETGHRIPVLALHDPATPVDGDILDQAGIDRVLGLPINPDRLAALIECLVAEGAGERKTALSA